jgi:hypothetical protein
MWTSALVALVVAQAGPVKVAAPSFSLVGLSPELGNVFQDRFVSRLASSELRVTTSRDIAQLLGLERQRQLLGCDAQSSQCLAELAGALGVDVVVSGNIAKSESGFIASVRALRTSDGQMIDAPSTRVEKEGELLDWLDRTADGVRGKILEQLRPGSTTPFVRWIPGLVGGALLVGGTVCLLLSGVAYGELVGPAPLSDISGTRARGETLMPLGFALVGVGAAGVVSSVLWSMTPSPVKAAWVPLRDGGLFAFSGALP